MRLRVLGGCGAWPAAGQACSGYLVDHEGWLLVIDPGYAVLPRLLEIADATEVDAVLVSHGHPDHCADLNPLLRARALRDDPAPALPVYALPDALAPVLALDRPGMLDSAYDVHHFVAGRRLEIGPFQVETALLPHSVPNVGMRLTAGGRVLTYTGDSGPSERLPELAQDSDVLLAEATYAEQVPADSAGDLSSARLAGEHAAAARAGHLVLTHLMPGEDVRVAEQAATAAYGGPVSAARPGLTIDLDD